MKKRLCRRDFISAAISTGAGITVAGATKAAVTPSTSAKLIELSALESIAAMKRGDFSAESYASALLSRCVAANSLNAFITIEPERVLHAARLADRRRARGDGLGALHGLPIPIKDSVNTKDLPTTAGTLALHKFRPKSDATIVQSLTNAGAIVLGKTNMHELSWGWTSNNRAFGAVRNPYDRTRIAGGSSGGTAVAVAARMAPLGVAEDTEGSIRVPAALCGICGFRPTTGRYPSNGVVPITSLFDQVGPLARTVRDLILFDSVASEDPRPVSATELQGLRLAVLKGYYFDNLDPEVERVTQVALAKLLEHGVEIIEAEIPDLTRLSMLTTGPIQLHDVLITLKGYLNEFEAGITVDQLLASASADVKADLESLVSPGTKSFVSDLVYRTAIEVYLPELCENFRAFFRQTRATAIIFPTTMVPAPLIGQDVILKIRDKEVPFGTAVARNIGPGSTAGLPGLVLPSGLTRSGLPVSLELDGPSGNDRTLLGVGLALSQILDPIPAPNV